MSQKMEEYAAIVKKLEQPPYSTKKVDQLVDILINANQIFNNETFVAADHYWESLRISLVLNYKNGIERSTNLLLYVTNQRTFDPIIKSHLDESFFLWDDKMKDFIFYSNNKHGGSLFYYRMALETKELKKHHDLYYKYLFWTALIYYDWRNLKTSKQYLNKAIFYAVKHSKDEKTIIRMKLYLGMAYYLEHKNDSAMIIFREAKHEATKQGDSLKLAVALNNIGQIYFKQKNYNKALSLFKEASKLFFLKKDTDMYFFERINLAKTSLMLGDYNKSLNILIEAARYAEKVHSMELMMEIHYFLGMNYKMLNLTDEAVTHIEAYHHIKDSLFIDELDKYSKQKDEKNQDEIGAQISQKQVEANKKDLTEISLNRSKFFIILSVIFIVLLGVIAYVIYRAYKVKDELNKTKNQLLSIVSHDVRAPLFGFIKLLEPIQQQIDSIEKEELKDYLEEIAHQARSCFLILNNLLLWSKFERGIIPFNPENISLAELVNQNISIYKVLADKKEMALSFSIPESINIYADKNMVDTILRNLTDNAIKYSNQKGAVLFEAKEINNYIEIAVIDSGVGISEQELKNLFNDSAIKKAGMKHNRGLGLIICKEFVRKNGGHIQCESKGKGQGSKFIFTLPKALHL